ncbi:MAG: SUMF1/EgtB/PvdO family nonheme iron enzyme, partial [Rhodospirillales bacterium]
LRNARNDAAGIAAKLRDLGFETLVETDAGLRDIGRVLDRFEQKLAKADVGLFFYAGHGIQSDGRNYLIPTDARLETATDLRFGGGVPVNEILGTMKRAGTALNIVILDACRDNPLPSRSGGRGLAVEPPPSGMGAQGTAILYSAAPGQVALDGTPGGNGVFTGELLKVLNEPGLTVEQVFKRTAAEVAARTGGRQDPWINSSVKGDFYFAPAAAAVSGPTASAPAPTVGAELDLAFWQSIQNSRDASLYEAYLAQFPEGTFAPLARAKLASLKGEQEAQSPRPATVEAGPRLSGVGELSPGTIFRDCENAQVAMSGVAIPGGMFCGPEMVVIPSGSFMMGSRARKREQPVHNVSIDYRFAVGRFEVTQAQWRSVMDTNPSGFNGDDRPVENVSWDDAQAFIRALGRRTGQKYRLLTEAEWEYVARATTISEYFWGDDIGRDNANCAGCGSSLDKRGTTPAGSFSGNRFGIHDMHGNVWEWVEDCWNDGYSGAPSDGSANLNGDCRLRVLRGGSWLDKPAYLRSALRFRRSPDIRVDNFGFRIARTL